VKGRAMRVFERLAEAEARVHGVPVEEVHFHETGALDAIADIVGIACALELLGVGDLFFSTLGLGGGKVECAHGTLPVPAPATAELVKGFRCVMGPIERELLTPTGAATLTALGRQEAPPPYRVRGEEGRVRGRDVEPAWGGERAPGGDRRDGFRGRRR